MGYRNSGFRRARPRVSFALATSMLVVLGMALSGMLQIELDLAVVERNPQAVGVALVFVMLAAALLYEW